MPDAMLGSTIDGRYKVLSRLGAGGMADVYLAEDEQLGRKIALKLLHRRFAEDPGFVERFRREAQAAAGLQHQNVVAVYDRGDFEGTYYIAMEYIPGRTLKQLIRDEAPLDPVRAIDITLQILRASRFAHRRGVIHRDLKPHNVMVGDGDQAKVTDFGIARAGASDMTETGSILGTAQYLSPEQAQGHAVSAASDLYSIAVVLYEMLTGGVPFDGDQAVTIAIKHVNQAPTALTTVNPGIPPELEQVVMWTLNKNPADRPADADQFIAALEHAKAAIISGGGGQRTSAMAAVGAVGTPGGAVPVPATASNAGPETAPPAVIAAADGDGAPPALAGPPETPRKRRRRIWWLALLVVLVAAGAGVVAYLLTRPAQKTVTPVVGEQVDTARAQLLNAGFKVSELSETSTHPVGIVFGENPSGGTKANIGSTVTLTVSAGPQSTNVPAVQGQTLSQAKKAIQKAHLTVEATQHQSSSQVAPGDVISTSPSAGTSVPVDSAVVLVVSSGKPLTSVPDVVGQSQASATSALQGAGLNATSTTQATSGTPAGNVVSESPASGTQVAPGSTVTIVVAKAPPKQNTAKVPDVNGDTPAAATSALQAAGFTVNQTTRNLKDKSKNGTVVSQSPTSGSSANKGSVVTIVVGQFQQPAGGTSTPTTTTGTTTTGP